MTKDVKERMDLLCGATNYSMALRNSEHAARYALAIHSVHQDSIQKGLGLILLLLIIMGTDLAQNRCIIGYMFLSSYSIKPNLS